MVKEQMQEQRKGVCECQRFLSSWTIKSQGVILNKCTNVAMNEERLVTEHFDNRGLYQLQDLLKVSSSQFGRCMQNEFLPHH